MAHNWNRRQGTLTFEGNITGSRSTYSLFLLTLSFEGTTKRAHNYLNQKIKGFYFWIS